MTTEPCPGYPDAQGCYLAETRTIHWTDGDVRTREHELAHVWMDENLTDDDHEFLRRRYFPRLPWIAAPRLPSASERLAEAWAYCRYPVKAGEGVEAAYGYKPRGYRHRRVCNTIAVLRMVR